MPALTYLKKLTKQLVNARHRQGVVVDLNPDDQSILFNAYIEEQDLASFQIAILGGGLQLDAKFKHQTLSLTYKQGQQLLGREISMLIVDCCDGFDANSFSAALGALVGGGIVFLINFDQLKSTNSKTWLARHLQFWSKIQSLDIVENISFVDNVQPASNDHHNFCTTDQQCAIRAVKKVVSGHRKRPLVITANRGRGKTSCLGMAAAELMFESSCHIIVTAPSPKSVKPLFEHVQTRLNQLSDNHEYVKSPNERLSWVKQTSTLWQLSNGAQLQFCAPDDLLLNRPNTDLLLVDEAAALPLASLQQMVGSYHRAVFSSTTHGYEGCGRGFTLKFTAWLNQCRPGWKQVELSTPIRWNQNDPLEAWLFNTLLLDADSQRTATETVIGNIQLCSVSKHQLLDDPNRLRDIFGLLVHAHYQTSPNDLIQILDDENIEVLQIFNSDHVVGCLLLNMEGGLDDSLIVDIQTGKRRPKGHLSASYLCNHIGIAEAAQQTSARVMRIAIEPNLQGHAIGTRSLELLKLYLDQRVDYISVSFGATAELIRFWSHHFKTVSLGTHRDQASGCYSAFMLSALNDNSKQWIEAASQDFISGLKTSLPVIYQLLDTACLVALLYSVKSKSPFMQTPISNLALNYAHGGNSYETAFPWLHQYIWNITYTITCTSEPVVPFFVLDKILFNKSWQQVAECYGFTGRKQVEVALRDFLLTSFN